MYVKFCRSFGEDKNAKDEAKENLSSKLSVELEGDKGKQTEQKAHLYRAGCFLLTIISLVLLLIVIILGLKLQTGSTVCPAIEETTEINKGPTCSYEQCQELFPSSFTRRLGCQQCADGWLALGRSCFYMSTFRLTWDESQRNCSSRGGALAIITDMNTQSYLTRKGGLKYWMGLRLKGGQWTWVNNDVLQNSYWAEGDWPQHDCGILNSKAPSDKNWIMAPCDSKTYFICQVEL